MIPKHIVDLVDRLEQENRELKEEVAHYLGRLKCHKELNLYRWRKVKGQKLYGEAEDYAFSVINGEEYYMKLPEVPND
jgi:hypothetical protein